MSCLATLLNLILPQLYFLSCSFFWPNKPTTAIVPERVLATVVPRRPVIITSLFARRKMALTKGISEPSAHTSTRPSTIVEVNRPGMLVMSSMLCCTLGLVGSSFRLWVWEQGSSKCEIFSIELYCLLSYWASIHVCSISHWPKFHDLGEINKYRSCGFTIWKHDFSSNEITKHICIWISCISLLTLSTHIHTHTHKL